MPAQGVNHRARSDMGILIALLEHPSTSIQRCCIFSRQVISPVKLLSIKKKWL